MNSGWDFLPSTVPAPGEAGPDSGLLSPAWAGTPVESVTGDIAWLQAMLDAEAALARAQAGLGLIPATAAGTITVQARASSLDLVRIARGAREAANPVVGFVKEFTRVVENADPAAGQYVHYGCTSQDVMDSAAMLVCRRALALAEEDLAAIAGSLAGLAQRYRDTPMAGRTLAQHAVPITFGAKAAGWLQLVLDATDRLRRLLDTGLPAQLGGAAGTLASYAEICRSQGAGGAHELAARYAAELGLVAPPTVWHVVRTPIVDVAAAASLVTGALGKIALDVQLMSRTEVAEVAEPAADGRGASSAMPQKRNPVLSTLILSAARQVPAYALVLNQSLLAEDERPAGAWHAEWQPLRECLRLVGGATHTAVELLAGLEVDAGRMAANLRLTGGSVVSERLALVLSPVLGRAAAKQLLTRATAESTATGRPLPQVIAALLPPGAEALCGDLDRLTDPLDYLGESATVVDRTLTRHRPAPAASVG